MRKALNFRKENPDLKCVDVFYKDLTTKPLACIQQIYEAHDLVLKGEVKLKMNAFLEMNKQHKYGRHIYDMKDFGLTKEGINAEFAEYLSLFNNLGIKA